MTGFAAIETATADDAVAVFANCTATLGGTPIVGIFDSEYADVFGTAGTQPVLHVATADAPTAAQGAAVVVNGVSYTVTGVEPDGTGMTLLRLQEV